MRALKIALFILLGTATIIAVYRFGFRKSIPDAPVYEQVVSILKQNDCFVCHSGNPKLPFYSSFPVIGPKMAEHTYHAFRFTDLESKVTEDIDDVTLSMLDHAISYETMPIAGYRLINWGTRFNKKEKSIIAGWIREKRGYDGPVCTIPESVEFDKEIAELGESLFNDARISLDGTISCATCHVLEDGGADHADERVSEGINGLEGGVNAPTVYNSDFNVRQFWNGRAADLREQAEGPATNPVEMGDQTWDQICERLRMDKFLVEEFERLYPGEGLTRMTVTGAIAELERTLITPDSRFDKYLKGNSEAISPEETRGYEKFKENACATCHTGVILGGRSFEFLDIYGDYFEDRTDEIAYNSDDDGLKGFTGKNEDLHKFKVPGLRNVALTAPYFHDGSLQTLEAAVKAMARYELGKELSEQDICSIVAFLNTLTGNNPYME
ncbi:MAG: heme-binding domain-containing protein [Bacteroidales bacterium]|nr:heme-binding domain-containing protein [Candidatus Cacconaster merdequi]